MSGDHHEPSIDELLAGLVAQRLAGETPDVEAVVAAHPDRADELRARFADLETLSVLWRDAAAGGDAAPSRADPALSGGARLGEFEIVRELGRGGMGTVYVARQEGLDRTVALKVIPQAAALSASTRQRFIREAKTMAALSHPNIVPVFAAGESEGMLYIAMEFVDGVSLADVLNAVRQGPADQKPSDVWTATVAGDAAERAPSPTRSDETALPPRLDKGYLESCCRTVASVADALDYAHSRGIIHRDIKPANILIDRDGRARLVDFGLAAINSQPHVTVSGEFFGTPSYVSPEQARGRTDLIDQRADVYSLGATLYECLTLSPPFTASSVSEILSQVLNSEPRAVRRANPSVPKDLNTIVMTALAKTVAERYATAQALSEDVERFLAYQPIQARRPGLPVWIVKRIRRRPVHALLVLAIVLAAIIGVVAYRSAGRHRQAQQQVRAKEFFELANAQRHGAWLDGRAVPKDEAKALATYEAAARLGHTGSMRELARMYQRGTGTPVDWEKAAAWGKRGVELGEASCFGVYGNALLHFDGRVKDALEILNEGVRRGDAGAMYTLGRELMEGRSGIPTDRARALKLFTASADAGYAWAMYQVGRAHDDLAEGQPDFAVARAWYEKAVAGNIPIAMVHLGWLHMYGRGGPTDPKKAAELFRRADALGDPMGRRELGIILLTGAPGVTPDRQRAIDLLSGGARAGDPRSMLMLGRAFDDISWGRPDYARARSWYEKAAAKGDPSAPTYLGLMHLAGRGVPRDEKRAVSFLEEGMRRGDVVAHYQLALVYLRRGGEANYKRARACLLPAAEQNYIAAPTVLGDMSANGHGVARSDEDAARWYQRATDLGEPTAMIKLAGLYDSGQGVPKDPSKGTELTRRSAATGWAPGMVAYGLRLENGLGMDKADSPQAAKQYAAAAGLGNWQAMEHLARCYQKGIGVQPSADTAKAWADKARETKARYDRAFAPTPEPVPPPP